MRISKLENSHGKTQMVLLNEPLSRTIYTETDFTACFRTNYTSVGPKDH